MPVFQEIPRPGRPRGTEQENILQMYRYQHRLAELIESAVNTIGDAGDRTAEQANVIERVIQGESDKITQLKTVTHELNTTIQQTNVELSMKAPKDDVESIRTQVTDATGKIASLGLSVTDLEANAVLKAEYEADKNTTLTLISNAEASIAALEAAHDGRISALELYTSDLEAIVVLKAVYETDKNAMLALVSNAEASIAALEATHNGRISALELYTSDLESRVLLAAEYEKNRYADLQLISNAEASIAALEVAHDGRIAALEVRATEQGTMIAAKADLILLDGYVKASSLEADVIRVVNSTTTFQLTASSITAAWITSTGTATLGGVDTAWVTSDLGRFGSLYVGDASYSAHSHAVSVDGGTITLGEVSSTGGSFNIADTQFYKDGVSAARTSGYNNGYTDASPRYIDTDVSYSSSSNTYSIYATVYKGDGTTWSYPLDDIVATSAYEAGYAAGYKAAKDAVVVTAGISWSNPAQYYCMIRYWGRATIGDEEVGYAASSESKNISGYV